MPQRVKDWVMRSPTRTSESRCPAMADDLINDCCDFAAEHAIAYDPDSPSGFESSARARKASMTLVPYRLSAFNWFFPLLSFSGSFIATISTFLDCLITEKCYSY
jgi:hypothetical protein